MTTLYKLTNKNSRTLGLTQWGEGVSNSAAKLNVKAELCTDSVIHAYASPHLAVLMAPAHVDYYASALLWLAEGNVVVSDTTKVGCRTLTTLRQIDKPLWTTEMRVEFAIRCALKVSSNTAFVLWANAWLDGSDRDKKSATAANAVVYATDAAANAVVYATDAAVYAATAVDAADAAVYAADAANAAAYVANATIDLEAIADSIYASHNPQI